MKTIIHPSFFQRLSSLALFCLGAALTAAPVRAQTIGYSLDLFLPPGIDTVGGLDAPAWKLTNLSSPGFEIVELKVGIGNPAFNFDSAQDETFSSGVSFVRQTPDTVNDGPSLRTNLYHYTFGGLGAGKEFRYRTDMDPDSVDAQIDFRNVLFNNGGAPNSTIFVRFSDGRALSMEMPDDAMKEAYHFEQLEGPEAPAVPEPGAALLFLPALAVVGLVRRRRIHPG